MLLMAHTEPLPVADARAGDPQAWDVLFRRYQMPLYVYICEVIGDPQTALDIVQETFLAATRHLATLREDGKFGSWMFGIAHQKCAQHWRKNRRPLAEAEPELLNDLPDAGPGPDEFLVREEQREQFYAALAQLPEAQRCPLMLHFLEDFSLDDISEITGVSPGTVKSRLHYGKRALKSLLERTTL
jgi:RNA polymerase sigma-70 factor (ECF subfamily)